MFEMFLLVSIFGLVFCEWVPHYLAAVALSGFQVSVEAAESLVESVYESYSGVSTGGLWQEVFLQVGSHTKKLK